MTIKQIAILGAILLGLGVTIDIVAQTGHVQESIPLGLIVGSALYAGRTMGWLVEKWKRDKEFANIVAESLIGKPNTLEPTPAAGLGNRSGQAMNAQQMNTIGARQQAMLAPQGEDRYLGILSSIGGALGK